MRNDLLKFLLFTSVISLGVTGQDIPPPDPPILCVQNVACIRGYEWDPVTCDCVQQVKCVQNKACKSNFDWDPVKCACTCQRLAKCAAGYRFDKLQCTCVKCVKKSCIKNFVWDQSSCSCIPKPCSNKCPVDYSPDPNDKCICKCNESPSSCAINRGIGWDRTTCKCAYYCDAIPPCPEGKQYSIWSCSCGPTCDDTVCPANRVADPDRNCDCRCTLPAQICPNKSQVWSSRTCKCHNKCGKKLCSGGNEPDPSRKCACKCLKRKQNCGDGMVWDFDQCECVESVYQDYEYV